MLMVASQLIQINSLLNGTTGAVSTQGTLNADGATTLGSTLNVTGATEFNSTVGRVTAAELPYLLI